MKKTASKIISLICVICMMISVTAFAAEKNPSVTVEFDKTGEIADIKLNDVNYLIYSAQLTLNISGQNIKFEIEPSGSNSYAAITQKNKTVTLYVDYSDLENGKDGINLAELIADKSFEIGSKADLIIVDSMMTAQTYSNINVTVKSAAQATSKPSTSGGGGGGGGSSSGSHNNISGGSVQQPTNTDQKPNQTSQPENGERFWDTANHWAKADIKYVTDLGLFEGTADDTFEPDIPMTRAMYVTVLSRFGEKLGDRWSVPCDNPMSFYDVADDAWYHDAVAWAGGIGLVSGIDDNLYGPELAITREQLAVITVNFANACGITLPSNTEEMAFVDGYTINDWAIYAVNTAQTAGLINGREDGTFAPQDTATRAEVSAILHRFVETVK